MNVIRPSSVQKSASLPVAVFIHGGEFVQGSGVDQRYNLSFIVQQSVAIGKPMLGVTINYRLGPWGFLQGDEVSQSGNSNFGLRDQRLALHWIKENIAAFGGDPKKVTIWGQSAGAASVGLHLTAFDGRDDGLFRYAIMESGGAQFYRPQSLTSYYETSYQALTASAGCSTASSPLDCLRNLPYASLNQILNTTQFAGIWNPQIDGDIIKRYSSQQLADGSFVKVPIIIGANSDEGTIFASGGVNDTADFETQVLGMFLI